jgi:type IV pilus biogenesis protein PilP
MVKKIKKLILLGSALGVTAFAQPYNNATVDELDLLERQRILLQKQLEVARLESELRDTMTAGGVAPTVATDTMVTSALSLVKVTGMEKSPQAVFSYGGYRIVTARGEMVLPNVQVKSVDATHVVLRDVTTGKESIMWLSNASKPTVVSGSRL